MTNDRQERVAAEYAKEMATFKQEFEADVISYVRLFFKQTEEEYQSVAPDMNGEDVWCEDHAFDRDEVLREFTAYMVTRFEPEWHD